MAVGGRRALGWRIHSWAGLNLSLFMIFVLATGTLSVLANEMDWLVDPARRATPPAVPASWGTLAAAAAQAAPGGRVVSVSAPPHAWFAPVAVIETAAGESRHVFLDPASGAVQGITGWVSIQQFLRQTHRRMMLPSTYGVPIVSSAALLLLISLASGLIAYKRFWRGFLLRPRRGGRQLAGDLHRLTAAWSLWFVTLIALTAGWYLVERLGGAADTPKPPSAARAPPALAKADVELDAAAIDRLAAVAHAAWPTLEIRIVFFPVRLGDPIAFMGQAEALLVRDPANAVWVDPRTAEALRVDRADALSAHQRIAEMADPLHFGVWGGIASKLAWFVLGLMMTALPVTGAIVYSRRLETARRADEAGAAVRHGPLGRWLRGMGAWAYVAAAAILSSLALTPFAMLE